MIKLAISVIFNKSCDIELTFLRQLKQTIENFDIIVSNNSFDSEDEDPLSGHLLLLDEIVNGSNVFSFPKLDDNNIKQLVLTKKYLVKILLSPILRQSTKKETEIWITGALAIEYRKIAQICAFFSKSVYVPTILEKILQCLNWDI